MSKVVNLRRARKKKKRIQKNKTAQTKREKFGLTKLEKALSKAEQEKQETHLDHHKIEKDES